VFSVPSYPRREFPAHGVALVSEFGEVKVVPAAAAVRKLVPHDEAAALDHVVHHDQALQRHGGALGGLEAVGEKVDGGGGSGA